MRPYAFISYSSANRELASRVAQRLTAENVWVDLWDLDAGDLLPATIAEAVQQSRWFILLASKKAMESRWVRYELNLAVVRWIEEANFRIVVARVDDCQIHPELAPFVRIEQPEDAERLIEDIARLISQEDAAEVPEITERRGRIVDRFSEIAAIERLAHQGMGVIYLWGPYGIGKTSVVQRAATEVFNAPLSAFHMTESHGALRLALELAADAGRPLPAPAAGREELLEDAKQSIAELSRKGRLILIDDVENALETDGSPREFLAQFFEKLGSAGSPLPPVLVCTTQRPRLPASQLGFSHIMKIGSLEDVDLLYCLENWIKLASPSQELPPRDKLEEVVGHLYGYPMAARLASYLLVQYSTEELIRDVRRFKELRIDIAKQLLGRARADLSDLDLRCLETLSVINTGAEPVELAEVLGVEVDAVREVVDRLSARMILFFDSERLQIHPIVRDYFWRRAYDTGGWRPIAERFAAIGRRAMTDAEPGSREFVRYSSLTYGMLVLSGRWDEARSLAYDMKEELRDAARKLYHAGGEHLPLSLEYLNAWLEIEPEDRYSRWFKARCLTRLERYKEAERELRLLEDASYHPYLVCHARGLMLRDQRKLDEAALMFRKGLDDRPDFPPLLRDLGDVLDRLGDREGALSVLERAHDLQPADPYIVSRYAETLQAVGRTAEALDVTRAGLSACPEEASLLHRLSMLLWDAGLDHDAMNYAERAVALNPNLTAAVLHLAAMEIRKGDVHRGEARLQGLPERIPRHARRTRDTVLAELRLTRGDTEGARRLVTGHDPLSDSFCAQLFIRIGIEEATRLLAAGNSALARGIAHSTMPVALQALAKFPDSPWVKTAVDTLRQLVSEFEE